MGLNLKILNQKISFSFWASTFKIVILLNLTNFECFKKLHLFESKKITLFFCSARIFTGTIENKDPNQSLIVRWAETQFQTGKWQCGYFSLANATALCYKLDPETMEFDENKIRQHYINIMFNNFPLTMFQFTQKKKFNWKIFYGFKWKKNIFLVN